MTPYEYNNFMNFKPLTDSEVKSRNKLKIYGTDELMPWTDIFTRISAGMPIEDLVEKYGHARKLTLFAILDGIEPIQDIVDFVDKEIAQRRAMMRVEEQNPVAARSMKEMINEYAPDVARSFIELTAAMIKKGQTELNDPECTTNDMKNIAAAVTQMTDAAEITQKFNTNAGQVGLNIQVSGFDFVRDEPPMIDTEVSE